jgi:hypothetical protein
MAQDGLPGGQGHCDVKHEQGLTGSALANQRDNLARVDNGGDDRLRGVGRWIHPIQRSQPVQDAFVGNGPQSSLKSRALLHADRSSRRPSRDVRPRVGPSCRSVGAPVVSSAAVRRDRIANVVVAHAFPPWIRSSSSAARNSFAASIRASSAVRSWVSPSRQIHS